MQIFSLTAYKWKIKNLKNLINAQIKMQLAPQTDASLPWVA